MTKTGFFLPGDAPSLAYRNIRDKVDGPAPKARAFIEDLWSKYRGLEDPHFLGVGSLECWYADDA